MKRIGARQRQIRPHARIELFGNGNGQMAYSQCCQCLQSCSSPWLWTQCPDQNIDTDGARSSSEMSEVPEPEVQKTVVQPSVNPLKEKPLQEMQFLEKGLISCPSVSPAKDIWRSLSSRFQDLKLSLSYFFKAVHFKKKLGITRKMPVLTCVPQCVYNDSSRKIPFIR